VPEPNVYFVVILVALLADFLVERAADILGLGALRREPPEELRDLYDPEKYRRSQEYTRAGTRLGIVSSTVSLTVLLGFWFLGGFAALDGWVGALAGALPGVEAGTVVLGLLYLGALGLGASVLSLPVALYSTFVIEERFGFNRTTLGTFFLDRLKGLAVGIVLGAPLLATVLWLFDRLDAWAWVICWAVATLYAVIVQWVAPRWIMPLFNRFEPLEEGELREAVTDYARGEGYDLTGVTVMDGSRRSSKANAFFTGFGRTKRLTLFDTLIEKLSTSEAVAVVAHEMGHYRLGHIRRGLALGILHQGAVLAALSFFLGRPGLYEAFSVDGTPIYAGLVFFSLLATPVERLVGVLFAAMSRRHEHQADRYAAETTGTPEALDAALRKIAADHLSNLTPHRFQVLLRYSHPPLDVRLRHIHAVASARDAR